MFILKQQQQKAAVCFWRKQSCALEIANPVLWRLHLPNLKYIVLVFCHNPMALCKRVLKSAADSAFLFRRGLYSSSSVSTKGVVIHRHASELVKPGGNRAFLVNTLALVRGLEAKGVPTEQAEAITSAITQVLNDSLENVAHSFVSKVEMERVKNTAYHVFDDLLHSFFNCLRILMDSDCNCLRVFLC